MPSGRRAHEMLESGAVLGNPGGSKSRVPIDTDF